MEWGEVSGNGENDGRYIINDDCTDVNTILNRPTMRESGERLLLLVWASLSQSRQICHDFADRALSTLILWGCASPD